MGCVPEQVRHERQLRLGPALGGGSDFDEGYNVCVDNFQNAYVDGYFRGSGAVDFDPDPVDIENHSVVGGSDMFLSKFDATGDFVWANTWGGPNSDRGDGIAVDDTWLVYVTGHFEDTVDFDPGGGDSHTSNGFMDAFLSKFDKNGNYEWTRSWGGGDNDEGYGTAIDSHGNVYVTGYFSNTVDFAPTDPPCNENPDVHDSNGNLDVFLTRYLPDGCW